MTNLINLNRARKERDKMNKRAQANENAVQYGRKKADKTLDATRDEQARKLLDGHKLDPNSEYEQE